MNDGVTGFSKRAIARLAKAQRPTCKRCGEREGNEMATIRRPASTSGSFMQRACEPTRR